MLEASYIGDDLTGTGFSLAGVRAHPVPDSVDQLWRLLLKERERRELVMLSADCARLIDEPLARLLEVRPVPPVVVLPAAGRGGPGAVVASAFRALGIEGLST